MLPPRRSFGADAAGKAITKSAAGPPTTHYPCETMWRSGMFKVQVKPEGSKSTAAWPSRACATTRSMTARPKPRAFGFSTSGPPLSRPAALAPDNSELAGPSLSRRNVPAEVHRSGRVGEGAIFHGVRRQLVEREPDVLRRLRPQQQRRPHHLYAPGVGVGEIVDLRVRDVRHRRAMPVSGHEQILRCGERLQPRGEPFLEIGHRRGTRRSLSSHRLNDRQQVLRPMRELAQKSPKVGFALPPFGDVQNDARHRRRQAGIWIMLGLAAKADPSLHAVATDNSTFEREIFSRFHRRGDHHSDAFAIAGMNARPQSLKIDAAALIRPIQDRASALVADARACDEVARPDAGFSGFDGESDNRKTPFQAFFAYASLGNVEIRADEPAGPSFLIANHLTAGSYPADGPIRLDDAKLLTEGASGSEQPQQHCVHVWLVVGMDERQDRFVRRRAGDRVARKAEHLLEIRAPDRSVRHEVPIDRSDVGRGLSESQARLAFRQRLRRLISRSEEH